MEETFREFHQRSGATMVYVTHDQSEAMALATDVAVMSEGRLLQVAAPAEIYARPEGRLVGGLVGRGRDPVACPSGRQAAADRLAGAEDDLAGAGGQDERLRADILVRPEDVLADADGISCKVTSSFTKANATRCGCRYRTVRR